MKEITFINKTAKSKEISRSTPEERKRINERNREYRSQRRNVAVKDASHIELQIKAKYLEEIEPFRPKTFSVKPVRQNATRLEPNQITTETTAQFVCPLTGTTLSSLGDPFDAFSIPLTAEHWRVIQFYRGVYYKRLWIAVNAILGTALGSFDFSRCSPEFVINECLQIPSRMWSLLASASCNLQHETNIRMKSMLLVNSGTASLRGDLQNSQLDRNSLLTSIHLHLAASSLREDQIAEAHLNGARAILQELMKRGVVISPPTLGMFALVDGQLAARLLGQKAHEEGKGRNHSSDSYTKLLAAASS